MDTPEENAMKTVRLPDGQEVEISSTPEAWWSEHGGVGHIDPALLAPDPYQPRKFMDQTELSQTSTHSSALVFEFGGTS